MMASPRSAPALLFASLRPEQWTKNLFVFAGLLFGHRLTHPDSVRVAAETFGVFCALSGTVYLFNDIADRHSDRSHPVKRLRPIASGSLSVPIAAGAGVALGLSATAAAFAIGLSLGVTALLYLGLLLLYSTSLKHVVIVDVLCIAAGFVLRTVGGSVAIGVPVSNWLVICTTLLALFLALAKRRHEIVSLADGAVSHRRILGEYSPYFVDQMVSVVTASSLVAYALYTISPDTTARAGTDRLPLTIPFVLYGIFRYLYLVHQKQGGGNPSTLVLTDRPLLACIALWALTAGLLLYTPLGH